MTVSQSEIGSALCELANNQTLKSKPRYDTCNTTSMFTSALVVVVMVVGRQRHKRHKASAFLLRR